jgi:hypothetical protein
VESELAWKDVLQKVCNFVDSFVVTDTIQYICQESGVNLYWEIATHTNMRKTEIRSSLRVQVRLPVQDTMSYEPDCIQGIGLAAWWNIMIASGRYH